MKILKITLNNSHLKGHNVTSIGDGAFCGCGGLTNVYYQDMEEDREDISIKTGNNSFNNAVWHYGAGQSYTVNYYAWSGEGVTWQQSKARGENLNLLDVVPEKIGYVFRIGKRRHVYFGRKDQPSRSIRPPVTVK